MAKGLQKAKIVITGKNGQLAKEFIKLFSEKGLNFIAFDKSELDITNFETVRKRLKEIKPDILINCAAYNLVDRAEIDRENCFLTNTQGAENLAKLCPEINCKIVHYSTDYVFDGKKTNPYTEKDTPNPLNYYGKTKLEGENKIKEHCENYLIFRVSWLYGKGKNNFVMKLLNWAKNNDTLQIAENEVSIPTSAKRVAAITVNALANGLKGLYHLTNSGYVSRYGLALKVKEILKLKNNIVPVNSDIFNLKAKRPEFSAMDNSRIANTLNIDIPQWYEDLKEFLKEIE